MKRNAENINIRLEDEDMKELAYFASKVNTDSMSGTTVKLIFTGRV